VGQFHFDPESYLANIREEVAGYDELQERVAAATASVDARRLLELGVGTGETACRVLALHPRARLTGIDSSAAMLERARAELPADRVEELAVARLGDRLPAGPFDLVFSALVVHHLDAARKRDLFGRVAAELRPGGRFVLGDVVVPERPADAAIPLTPGFDLPDRADDQLTWLEAAGLCARLVWADRDLAVLTGDRALTTNDLTVRPASDAEAVHALLTECGTDMDERLGLRHWLPAYPLELVRAQVESGDVYEVLAGGGTSLVATFTIRDEPPAYYRGVPWSPEGEPAVYVARLAVRPSEQGGGLGSWCMAWIEAEAVAQGARAVRLDAFAGHSLLLRFYRKLGYDERATLTANDRPMVCFEKLVAPQAALTQT
jgi:tRNA (cmo5U34)-methyltransferase